jgi:uncharacterized membrane protein YqhA
MIRKLFASTRYLFAIAVLSTLFLAMALLLYGALVTGNALLTLVRAFPAALANPDYAKYVVVSVVEVLDLFLLATVTYIIAIGLYSLFIDDKVPLPSWLVIHSLDSLKARLASVVIVVLGVSFMGLSVTWSGEGYAPLVLGAGVGLVIAALTFFLWRGHTD